MQHLTDVPNDTNSSSRTLNLCLGELGLCDVVCGLALPRALAWMEGVGMMGRAMVRWVRQVRETTRVSPGLFSAPDIAWIRG
jgi:hypothetical protein